MMHNHRAHLDGHLCKYIDNYGSLGDVFPKHKWLFMRRRDVINQAISWHVAASSQRWHVSSDDDDFKYQDIPYDYFSILSKVMILCANSVNWETYFALMKIAPHTIVYEDFIVDVEATVSGIIEFLEVDTSVSGGVFQRDGGLSRLYTKAKATYDSLKARFMDDFMRIGHPDDNVRLGPSFEKWNKFFFESQWRM